MTRSAGRASGAPGLALALAAIMVHGGELAGQEVPDSTLPADTLVQEVDSARLAILQRLERLARPVGADSVLFVQDSVRLAEAAAGQRGTGIDSIATALMGMPGYSLTEYQGQAADFAATDRVLVLRAPPEGRARVTQAGMVIEADSSITFDEPSGAMRTVGEATFTHSSHTGNLGLDLQIQAKQGLPAGLNKSNLAC